MNHGAAEVEQQKTGETGWVGRLRTPRFGKRVGMTDLLLPLDKRQLTLCFKQLVHDD